MSTVYAIVAIAAPLLLLTTGALVSEYAGRLAMFMECIINLGAFCCFACTAGTGNAALGTLLSVAVCTLAVTALERLASRCRANMFLVSLAMNLLFAALITFCSVRVFGTRGVLYAERFTFSAPAVRLATTLLCYALAAAQLILLRTTTAGLALRITGSNPEVLAAQGISADRYRCLAWALAAASGAFCGCTYALRLSSYVPGMAGGRGWTALAAVFLGRKNPALVAVAVLVFAGAEYASATIQNIPLFAHVPSSVLLALPGLSALALILVAGPFFPGGASRRAGKPPCT